MPSKLDEEIDAAIKVREAGKPGEALSLFAGIRERVAAAEDYRTLAKVLNHMGLCLQHMARWEEAIAAHTDALSLATGIDYDGEVVASFRHLSICEMGRGSFRVAYNYAINARNRALDQADLVWFTHAVFGALLKRSPGERDFLWSWLWQETMDMLQALRKEKGTAWKTWFIGLLLDYASFFPSLRKFMLSLAYRLAGWYGLEKRKDEVWRLISGR